MRLCPQVNPTSQVVNEAWNEINQTPFVCGVASCAKYIQDILSDNQPRNKQHHTRLLSKKECQFRGFGSAQQPVALKVHSSATCETSAHRDGCKTALYQEIGEGETLGFMYESSVIMWLFVKLHHVLNWLVITLFVHLDDMDLGMWLLPVSCSFAVTKVSD